jgi:hypothetical protein
MDDVDEDGGGGGLAGRTYRALQTSRSVWASTSALSPEAHTATFALDLMLRKVSEKKNAEALLGRQQQQQYDTPLSPLPPPPYTPPRPTPPVVMVDSSTSGASSTTLPSAVDPGLPYADFMADVIDGATAPDWVSLLWLGEMVEVFADDGCRIFWISTSKTRIWKLLMCRLGMERQASHHISWTWSDVRSLS